MFQVLHTTVQTDKGKQILKSHMTTYNAQAAFKDLTEHALTSTAAKISSRNLLTYITSTKLSDGSWRGTTTNFILHWKEHVCRYQKMTRDKSEHFSDNHQRTMLQNAVDSIPKFRQVKTNTDLQASIGANAINFDEYDALLQSAATQYDLSL